MEDSPREPAPTLEIEGLEPLKIMSDPLRSRIVELLRRAPATVKQLSALLETAPRSLYYHVNLLERHGLIRVVRTRLVSGIVEKTYRATAYVFLFADLMGDGQSGASRFDAAAGGMFNATLEELADSVRCGRVEPYAEPQSPDYALSWTLLNLPAAEAASFLQRFAALVAEFGERATDVADRQAAHGTEEQHTYRLLFAFFRTYFHGQVLPYSSTGGIDEQE